MILPIKEGWTGKGKVLFPNLCNIYGCEIGENTTVGPFVEIQKDVIIGNWCKIQSHTFICSYVHIYDRVFVGHNVSFVNDRFPIIFGEINYESIIIENDVSIGTGAVILSGVTIGHHSIVGAGAVVTKNVPPFSIVAGNPAEVKIQATSAEGITRYVRNKIYERRGYVPVQEQSEEFSDIHGQLE